jgi:hypothetical protein
MMPAPAGTVAAPQQFSFTSVQAAAPKRKFPSWTSEKARKAHDAGKYIKIVAEGDGYKSGFWTTSGALRKIKSEPNVVYLPGLRLAGDRDTLTRYVQELVSTGAVPAEQANQAFATAYTAANPGSLGLLEREIAGLPVKPKGASAAKSALNLQRIVALKGYVNDKVKSAQMQSVAVAGGKSRGGGPPKSLIERIRDEARENIALEGRSRPGEFQFRYVNVTNPNKPVRRSYNADSSVQHILPKQLPLAAKTREGIMAVAQQLAASGSISQAELSMVYQALGGQQAQ